MVEMLPDILKNLWTNKDKKSARKMKQERLAELQSNENSWKTCLVI